MNTHLKAAMICGCLPILAACGGSSTPTATTPAMPVIPVVPTVTFPSAASIGSGPWTANDLLNLAGAKAAFNQGITDTIITPGIPAALATSSATYNGTLAFTAPTRQPKEFYGRMTMNIDFGANAVSGQASDFGLAKNTTSAGGPLSPLSGTLGFRRSTMTGPNFQTAMEGTLGGVGGPYVIRTQLNGTVYTNGNTSLVQGSVTGDMSSDVIPVMNFSSGEFLATQ